MATRTYADAIAMGKTGLAWTFSATPPTGSSTWVAANSTDRVPPGLVLVVKNANASALTVTLLTADIADADLVIADRAQTVIAATNGLGLIYVPNRFPFVDTDGNVGVTFSVTATVWYQLINDPT